MQSMTPTRMKPTTNASRLGRVARWRRGGFTVPGSPRCGACQRGNAPGCRQARDCRSRGQDGCEVRQDPRRPKGPAALLRLAEQTGPLGMHGRLPYRLAATGAPERPDVRRHGHGSKGVGHGQGTLRDTGHLGRQGPVHLHRGQRREGYRQRRARFLCGVIVQERVVRPQDDNHSFLGRRRLLAARSLAACSAGTRPLPQGPGMPWSPTC
jgi:hypothetical protein